MNIHSIYELTIANDILSSRSKLDKFGTAFWSNLDIKWAKGVKKFFTRIYKLAKSFKGHWTACIKLAWMTAKGLVRATKISSSAKRLLKTAKRLVDGSMELQYEEAREYRNTMSTRIKRQFKRS